jgi:hypothetical protein
VPAHTIYQHAELRFLLFDVPICQDNDLYLNNRDKRWPSPTSSLCMVPTISLHIGIHW